jgi:hypothetical protein
MFSTVELSNLPRSPVRVRRFKLHYPTDDLLSQFIPVPVRPTAFFLHSAQSTFHKSLSPLVSCLPADSILPAQRSKISAAHCLHRKLDSLVHSLGFFPRHLHTLSEGDFAE